MRWVTAGGYQSKRGVNSTATLRLVPDANGGTAAVNVACDVKWVDENGVDRTKDTGYISTRSVLITVREGPLNGDEVAAQRGWLFNTTDIGPGSAAPAPYLSVRDALSAANGTTRTTARMVGCVVVGEDPVTGLPVSVASPSKLALTWPGYTNTPRLVDFTYPIAPAALADFWRPCSTDADCKGAPAGNSCLCSLSHGCKPETQICQQA